MGTCDYCGERFPLTRSTRKYCTPRCKTNACLDRTPSRLSAAEVRDATLGILDRELDDLADQILPAELSAPVKSSLREAVAAARG